MIEFIKGQWYKWGNSKGGLKYWKFSHKNKNNYYYSESIQESGKHKYSNNDYCNIEDQSDILINIEEIAKYLPLGHKDLQPENVLNSIQLW